MRRIFLFTVKAAITGLLIYFAVRAVSLQAVIERVADIRAGWLVAIFALLVGQIGLQALRWQQIVHAAGFPLPAAAAARLSLIAAFFNQTLPSTIGGDAARIWMLAQSYKAGWRAAVYSVFVDRAIGVFALAVLVALCLPWTYQFVQDPIARAAATFVGMAGISGGIVFAFLSFAKGTWIERIWGVHHLIAASLVLRAVAKPAWRAAFVAASSLLIHLVTVVVAWSTAQAIGASVSFLQMTCLIPPVVLIATVPITIAGWGLRESLMITAFTLAGLNPGDALVISLLLGVANFAVGLIGGILWVASRLRLAELEAEPEAAAAAMSYERR
jgi:uncharacterized membrane protein YbhN (UPF0104 family)